MKKILSLILFVSLYLGTYTCKAQVKDATIFTVRDNNRQRSFRYYVPKDIGKNPSLVFCFHGSGGSSINAEQASGFNTLADKYKFIVCYPQAMKIGDGVQWNVYVDDSPGHGGIGVDDSPNDVIFTEDMIEYFAGSLGIDSKRVFASGISNGGFMCYFLAVAIPDKISAFAPVAANLWGDNSYLQKYFSGNTFKPVSILHAHGTADNIVAYPDKNNKPNDFIYPLASFSYVTCNNTVYTTSPITNGVDRLTFCSKPNEIVLIRQKSLGHAWSLAEFDLSTEIIRFFGLDIAISDINETVNKERIVVLPNPVSESFSISVPNNFQINKIEIINQLGQCVQQLEVSVINTREQVNISTIPDGMYTILLSNKDRRTAHRLVIQH